MHCPLCDNLLSEKVDKYYYVCSKCGGYVKDKKYYPSLKQEKERYEEHNNDVSDTGYQKFTSPITQVILQRFSSSDKGLDYGCGTGPVITKILEKEGYNVKLYDPFFYPDEKYLHYLYDYIFCCEVFEHFKSPKNEIQKLTGLLKTNGLLLTMTHLYLGKVDFTEWYYRRDPTHIFIYTPKTIEYIKEVFSLKIEQESERLVIFKK